MIIVIKIITGEEIVGVIEEESIHNLEFVNIYDPMYVREYSDTTGNTMNLEDCLMLSDQKYLTFKQRDVITSYTPTENLQKYYVRYCEYIVKRKRNLHSQIKQSIQALDRYQEVEVSQEDRISDIITAITGTRTVH